MITKKMLLDNARDEKELITLMKTRIQIKREEEDYSFSCPGNFFKNYKIGKFDVTTCKDIQALIDEYDNYDLSCQECWDFFLQFFDKNNNLRW